VKSNLFIPGFVVGMFVAIALHYFVPCDQAKLGGPRFSLSVHHD
jgi:hypothetical protein